MALDGIVTRAIVHELQGIRGGRINKIHQPNDHDILLNLRAQGGSVKLLLSVQPDIPACTFYRTKLSQSDGGPYVLYAASQALRRWYHRKN